MAEALRREFSLPEIPEGIDPKLDDYLRQLNEVVKDISMFMASWEGVGHTDRGDATVSDFDEGDSPVEAVWTDLNFGPNGLNIVPANITSIDLVVQIVDDSVGSFIALRKNGQASEGPGNTFATVTQVASVVILNAGTVGCDVDGVIEYYVQANIDSFDITVTGWNY